MRDSSSRTSQAARGNPPGDVSSLPSRLIPVRTDKPALDYGEQGERGMRALILRGSLYLALLGLGSAAQAAFVTSSTLNCRAAPRTSATVLARLSRGDRVSVLTRSGGWARIDPAGSGACWVSSRFLGDNASASRALGSQASSRSRASARQSLAGSPSRRSRTSSSRSYRARGDSIGGSCPCSGSKVCVGPRGGRYCITSGGNKRYGV